MVCLFWLLLGFIGGVELSAILPVCGDSLFIFYSEILTNQKKLRIMAFNKENMNGINVRTWKIKPTLIY